VVHHGRASDLQLLAHNREQAMRPLAHALFEDLLPFAEMLDAAYSGQRYSQTLSTLRQRIDHPELTPSAQVLEGVHQAGGFQSYSLALAHQHQQNLLKQALDPATSARFEASVQASLSRQVQLEAAEQGSFEDHVARYYA